MTLVDQPIVEAQEGRMELDDDRILVVAAVAQDCRPVAPAWDVGDSVGLAGPQVLPVGLVEPRCARRSVAVDGVEIEVPVPVMPATTASADQKTILRSISSVRPRARTWRPATPSGSTAWLADLLGKSGHAMLDALVPGTTDPKVLAELARGVLRKELPALREALEGRLDAEHALVVGQILAQSTSSTRQASVSPGRSRSRLPRFATAIDRLCTIPGVERRAAEVLIAETGCGRHDRVPDRRASSPPGPVSVPATTSPPASSRSGRTRQGSK